MPNVFLSGQTLPAATLNENFAVIYNNVNGNLTDANISSSAGIQLSKLQFNPGSTLNNQMLTGNNTWGTGLTTDTQPRLTMTSDGYLVGGTGSATGDIGLKRSAVGTWQLYKPGGGIPTLDLNGGTIEGVGDFVPDAGAGTADQVLAQNTTGTGLEYKTLTAGANVTITPGPGTITISSSGGGGGGSGTVTSVSMTGDNVVYNSSVTGSPITVSGTLIPSLKTQSANTIFAGPTSGGAATPTFRSLTLADYASGATANYILGVNAGNSALEYKQLIAGSNVTITPGVGSVTIAASGGGGTPDLTGSAGVVVQTGASSYVARTITGTSNQISVSNGSGVSAAPTISLSSTLVAPGTVSIGGPSGEIQMLNAAPLRFQKTTGDTTTYNYKAAETPASTTTINIYDPGSTSVQEAYITPSGAINGTMFYWKRNGGGTGGYLQSIGSPSTNDTVVYDGSTPVWQPQGKGVQYSQAPVTTAAGSGAGFIYSTQPEQGSSYKKYMVVFDGFTDAGRTLTFPTAFSLAPSIACNGTGIADGAFTISTTQLTIPACVAESGTVTLEGR